MSHFLAEIFPIEIAEPTVNSFRLTPEVDREIGNRLSWRFSNYFPDLVVIWENKFFWVLGKPDTAIPERSQWKAALVDLQTELKSEIGDRDYSMQWAQNPQPNAEIFAQLAVRILKNDKAFASSVVWSQDRSEVKRNADFWAETFTKKQTAYPALALTLRSSFEFAGTLENFYENHPFRQDPEKLLVGLKVKDIERNSLATIAAIAGNIGDRRDKLVAKATGSISKQKLIETAETSPNQPVVSVCFGKDTKKFDYAMAALKPSITQGTADRFEIDYGKLLKAAKMRYQERKEGLESCKQDAIAALNLYGIELRKTCLNSSTDSEMFSTPTFNLEDTPLLFGNNKVFPRSKTLTGLSEGGVYRRHKKYENPQTKIRLSVLKVGDFKVKQEFIDGICQRLKKYHLETLPCHRDRGNIEIVSLEGLTAAESRARVEQAVEDLMMVPIDIVLTLLPQSDRHADENDGGSFYTLISSRLLRREIASQAIYERTFQEKRNWNNIFNQVIPGILAKLGNLPFVLKDPLEIADRFIGLDVSRQSKRKRSGSRNACASVRLYGKQGEFNSYRLEDAVSEGEEIDCRTLEQFLPGAELRGKTVLIYRDGRFCGDEVKNLRDRERAIRAEFILVECAKSQIPRMYELQTATAGDRRVSLDAPPKGLALHLSPYEVILVTTEVKSEEMGLPYPLRLRVIPKDGQQVSLDSLIEATLKLTLLHHGALKEPRLPIPLYGSDRIARRRLQGISPGSLDGDRQFWL